MNSIQSTNFQFPYQVSRYQGKVRDVYNINEEFLVIIASDRISAFDHILPRAIPGKGQVLNQTAAHFFNAVDNVVPNHVLAVPDPNVTIGRKCKPYPIEVVVRGYLAGHAWRVYKEGGRELCGVSLPDGLKEGDAFPEPIITPATKSQIGHDEDISEYEILKSRLVSEDDWLQIKHYAFTLFDHGQNIARERGLILVDTKYEFGYIEDDMYLIDEIHTPDSSRYYFREGYDSRQAAGEKQEQLSKEFVREWLMKNGFQGKEGQQMPEMDDPFVNSISRRYIELFERVTGKSFEWAPAERIEERIMDNTLPIIQDLIASKG